MSFIEQMIFIIKLSFAVAMMLVISATTAVNDFLSEIMHDAIGQYRRFRRRLKGK